MKHSNDLCINSTEFNFFEKKTLANDKTFFSEKEIQKGLDYLIKVGATSALFFTICNSGYIPLNFHYSEVIETQQVNKIGIQDYFFNLPILDTIDSEHEIAYATRELENLNPISAKKIIKVKGRIVRIDKGTVSKV